MRIARMKYNGEAVFVEEREGKHYLLFGSIASGFGSTNVEISGEFLAPVAPSKVVALGANYSKHAKELQLKVNGEPTLFLKPPSAVIGDGANIVYPSCAKKVDYEAELAVVIGKTCKNIVVEQAEEYVLGYTCANDVSERVFQKLDGQWTRAKGFDTFCPLGRYIVTDANVDDVELCAVRNGVIVQRGRTSDMMHGVMESVAFVSTVMTLLPGDVILTGTPDGIGEIKIGDEIEIRIDGVGCLKNRVVAAE